MPACGAIVPKDRLHARHVFLSGSRRIRRYFHSFSRVLFFGCFTMRVNFQAGGCPDCAVGVHLLRGSRDSAALDPGTRSVRVARAVLLSVVFRASRGGDQGSQVAYDALC